MNRTLLAAALSVASVSLSTAPALAGAFQLNERSTKALGASLSGATSAASDVTFTAFNPATLATVEHREIGASANGVFPIADGTVALTGEEVEAGQGAFVPSLSSGYRLNEHVVLGLTSYSPFGLATDYPDNWAGTLEAQTSKLTTVVVAPSIGFNVTDGVMFGASINVIYADARLTNAAVQLDGDNVDVSFSLGALFQPTDTTQVGLSYHNGYDLTLEGSNKITALPGAPKFDDMTASASLPTWMSVGVTQEVTPDIRVMAEGRWIDWSVFDRIDISTPSAPDLTPVGGPDFQNLVEVQDYDDSFFVGLGAEYDLSDRITLRSGIAWDQTPTTDESRTARVPDQDRLWLSAGASYGVTDRITVDASYSYLHLLEDPVVELETPPTTVDYDGATHIVSVGGSFRF